MKPPARSRSVSLRAAAVRPGLDASSCSATQRREGTPRAGQPFLASLRPRHGQVMKMPLKVSPSDEAVVVEGSISVYGSCPSKRHDDTQQHMPCLAHMRILSNAARYTKAFWQGVMQAEATDREFAVQSAWGHAASHSLAR